MSRTPQLGFRIKPMGNKMGITPWMEELMPGALDYVNGAGEEGHYYWVTFAKGSKEFQEFNDQLASLLPYSRSFPYNANIVEGHIMLVHAPKPEDGVVMELTWGPFTDD